MSAEKALAVVEQREVAFYGDEIIAVLSEDGTIYVPLRPICDSLGIMWNAQLERIKRNPILSELIMSVRVTRTDIGSDSREPRTTTMAALPLDYLNGWLFGIDASRVKTEIRDRVLQYQRECYLILAQAFARNQVTAASRIAGTDVDELLQTGQDPEAQAYRMALAIANMARQQLMLRYQIQEQEQRLEAHEDRLGTHAQRLDQIESMLGDTARHISTAQAGRISQAVKAIALELGKRTGRNEFGGIYGELYRRFEVAGYRELPAGKYDEAMNFLRQWYGSLTDDGKLPF